MKNSTKILFLTSIFALSLPSFADDSDLLPKSKLSKTEMSNKLQADQCYTNDKLFNDKLFICKEKDNTITEIQTIDIDKDPRLVQATKKLFEDNGMVLWH